MTQNWDRTKDRQTMTKPTSAILMLVLIGFGVGCTKGTSKSDKQSAENAEPAPVKADSSTSVPSTDFSNIDYSVPKVDYTKGPAGQKLTERDGDPEEGKAVTETGYTDTTGKFARHGVRVLWYRKNDKKFAQEEWSSGKRHGTLMSWDNNDQKRLERTYRDGEKHGKETIWDEKGRLKSEAMFAYGKQHGVYKAYYFNGRLVTEGVYKDGLQHGQWIYLDESGKKDVEEYWIAGKKHGHFVAWHPNGQKRMEATYVDGNLSEVYTEWFSNGQKSLETTYINIKGLALEHGTRHEWDEKGKEERFEYLNGKFQFKKGDRLSRKAFVKALESLGYGPPTVNFTDDEGRRWVQIGGNQELQQWVEAFGEPQGVRNVLRKTTTVHQWTVLCTDGPVTLQGMVARAPSGATGRVAIFQLGFF